MSGHHPDRRDFLALGVGALALAGLPRALRPRDRLIRRRIPVMGTVAEIAVRHSDEAWAQRSIDLALDELRRVDRTMSRFRADSDVGRVNGARGGVVTVADDTALVLAAGLGWAAASDGWFDPCLGGLTAGAEGAGEGGDGGAEAHPAMDTPARLASALEVDRDGTVPRVRLHHPAARVDLGGIAKGHAVDLAARALRDRGIFHALVNAGGDLVAMGTDADGEPWTVGVRDPSDPTGIVAVLPVADAAVATSGRYVRGPHLLDPHTGAPVRTATRSLTVQAPTCMDADAAATALFGAPEDVRERILAAGASGAVGPAGVRIAHLL